MNITQKNNASSANAGGIVRYYPSSRDPRLARPNHNYNHLKSGDLKFSENRKKITSPNKKDLNFWKIPKLQENKKRSASSENRKDSPSKKNKTEKFDALFGDEDVDLRKLPLADNRGFRPRGLLPPPTLGRRMPNREIFGGIGPNFNNGPCSGMGQCPLNPYYQASQSPPPLRFDNDVSGGLDMLASLLPSSMAPPSPFSGYSVAKEDTSEKAIPGLEKKPETSVAPNINSILQNVNVNDVFAKLVATGIVSTLPEATGPKAEANEPNNLKWKNYKKQQSHKLSSNEIKPVDLLKSETLEVRQPELISLLYNGMQCSSCGVRFPPEHTADYTQHLDWHFRQNRAKRDSQRKPNSRGWYHNVSDWMQYQETEDLEEREESWFEREQQAAEAARTEEAAAARRETSSVPLTPGAPTEQSRCFLCHESFLPFYNHDTDEWHLKNAIECEGNNFHPICLDDHKASLAREQEASNEDEENKTLIELDKENAESESQESIMDGMPDVEILEEDDDVFMINEPVETIVLDDLDTDEETEMERKERDANVNMPIDFVNIKIKQEPIDPDDEPIITSAQVDTTHAAVLSSIDGNVQLEPTVQISTTVPRRIRINITKPLVSKEKEAAIAGA